MLEVFINILKLYYLLQNVLNLNIEGDILNQEIQEKNFKFLYNSVDEILNRVNYILTLPMPQLLEIYDESAGRELEDLLTKFNNYKKEFIKNYMEINYDKSL